MSQLRCAPPDLGAVLARAVDALQRAGLTVSTAESCTGGWIAKLLTDTAGSSAWMRGGVVAYADALKVSLLGVEPQVLSREGAVSEAVVRQMAAGVRERAGSDLAVAVSGVAGPGGGSAEKPVGSVCLCVYDGVRFDVESRRFGGDRDDIRKWTASTALEMTARAAVRRASRDPNAGRDPSAPSA